MISVPADACRRAASPMTSVIDSLVFTLTTMIRIPPSFLPTPCQHGSTVSPPARSARGWPGRALGPAPGQQPSSRGRFFNRLAAQDRATDDPLQPVARVGRHGMPVVQPGRINGEAFIRGEDAEIRVVAGGDPALAGQASEPG